MPLHEVIYELHLNVTEIILLVQDDDEGSNDNFDDGAFAEDVLDRLATAHRECSNNHLDPILREINALSSIPVNIVRKNNPVAVVKSTSALLSGHTTARLAMQRFSEAQLKRSSDDDETSRNAYIEKDYRGNAVAFVIRKAMPGIDLSAAPELTRVLPGQPIPFVKLDDLPDIPSTAQLHRLDPEQTVAFGAIAQRLQMHISGMALEDVPQLTMSVFGTAGKYCYM